MTREPAAATRVPRWAILSLPLAVAWTVGCSASTELPAPGGPTLFREVTRELGLPEETGWPDGTYDVPEITAVGVALLDYDGDGDLDLLQLQTTPPGAPETPSPNRLWRQEQDGRFSDATRTSGLGDPGRAQGVAVGDTPTGPSLYLARPIQIKNPGCLVCHSTPEAAPAPMVALYGDGNGFGWHLDEVVGAQIVSVPTSVPVQRANQAFVTFMGTLVAVFFVITVVLNVMLRRIVIAPVLRMAGIAEGVSRGDMDAEPFDVTGKDEIATLAGSFTRMRRSLEKAMKMLR